MLRCMLGSVKCENPKGKGKLGHEKKVRCSPRLRASQASRASQENSAIQTSRATPRKLPCYCPIGSLQDSSMEEPNSKWVFNLSSEPLTPAQRSVLARGPNFAVSPRQPPNLEYITAIESAYTKLSQQDTELRANINRVLRSSHPPSPI